MTKSRKKVNPLNNLGGKEWLLFQKSWFRYETKEKLYLNNLQFFTKTSANRPAKIGITAHADLGSIDQLSSTHPYHFSHLGAANDKSLDYVMIDLLNEYHCRPRTAIISNEDYLIALAELAERVLKSQAYLTVFARNVYVDDARFDLAFEVAKVFKRYFSIRDEKIACPQIGEDHSPFYCLHFKKNGE